MRKALATVLSVLMLLGTLMPIASIIISAAETEATFTQIDFDSENDSKYYGDSRNLNGKLASSDTANDKSHGNAIYFTNFSSVWNSNSKWPQAVRIGNYSGTTAFKVEKGAKYKLTFDYKKSKVDDAINLWAVVVSDANSAGNLGTLNSWQTKGNTVYAGWIGSGNSSAWATYSGTIVAPADGEIMLSTITYNTSDLKNQKFWMDNIKIEKLVSYDGSKVNVKYNNNDGTSAVTKEMYVGYSYGHPSRDGYVFDGWYADKALTVEAPSSVRADCAEVWAKWSEDNRVPQSFVNTYDDEGITFAEKDGKTYLTTADNTEYSTDNELATSAKAVIAETDGIGGGRTNALHFTGASAYTWQWPVIAKIYDNTSKTANTKPNAGSAYEISLKYRVDQKPSDKLYFQIERVNMGIGNPNGKYNTSNIYLADLAEISDATDGWVTASGIFYTTGTEKLTITLVAAGGSHASSVDVWVDDIEVTERLDVYGIYFETNGGSEKSAVNCIAGYDIPVIDPPIREGYYFNGWYTDPALTNGFVYGEMPTEALTLYAAWVKQETEAKDFYTGFEEGEYENSPYGETENSVNASDNTMKNAVWHKDDSDEAYDGNGYVTFDDGAYEASNENSQRYMSIGLYNSDGSPYQIIAGKRYRISMAYRHMGQATNTETYIKFLATQQVPGAGINSANSTEIWKHNALSATTHASQFWGEYSNYVIPSVSGVLKLAVTANSGDITIDIDNIKIEVLDETECIKVEYYGVKPDSDDEPWLISTRLGAPGDLLIAGNSMHNNGYAFDGWRNADGEVYLSNYFPSEDLKLYGSWREADDMSAPSNDWSSGEITIDFEDTANVKAFYEDGANNYHPENGVFVMVNDPENAHSGNNYFKYYNCGHWTTEYLRSMKLYDPKSPGNQIYLEPNSVYKVSFWLNIESVSASNLYLATFPNIENRKDWEIANENYITQTNKFEEYGKWVKYENTVVTGDDADGDGIAATLGFVLYGGYLTASLDDITVTKLSEITVSFDSNGGSDVGDIEQLSHDYIIAPDEPEREGYTFTGWYTDKELKNKFDFTKTLVTKTITLYAGWEKIPEAPKSTFVTRDVTHVDYTETSEEVDIVPDDAELDGQITVNGNDTVGAVKDNIVNKVTVEPEEDGISLMWIIIIICAAILLISIAVTAIIILKKRKNRI